MHLQTFALLKAKNGEERLEKSTKCQESWSGANFLIAKENERLANLIFGHLDENELYEMIGRIKQFAGQQNLNEMTVIELIGIYELKSI